MNKVTLYELCPEAKDCGIENTEITSVTDDTRSVCKGSVFVCIKGARFDGHNAAKEMLEKGAAAVVVSHDTGCERQIICENTRLMLSILASRFYGNPAQKLKMLAVTGTNGKTTTAHFVKHIINYAGKKCGCIGTAGNDLCGGDIISSLHGTPTTPNAVILYSWLCEMVKNGAEYCVTEASSQALHQYRIGCDSFLAAGFTNLTRDHLDYHGSMENYYEAKKRLFTLCENAVINIDDEYGKMLCGEFSEKCITYSVKSKADYYAEYIRLAPDGAEFMLTAEREKKAFRVKIPMTGIYNVQNALCAVAIASAAGIDTADCVKAFETLEGVDGRMKVVYKGNFTVITDYAHTDDALSKMLSAVRQAARGRVICVFGAAGDRDREKRPLMGKAVEELADMLVITSDNPAHENSDDIIEAVFSGTSGKKPCVKISDRKQAIKYALTGAKKDDVVVLAGKGQEKYQIIGDEYIPFCEAEIVNEIMKERN